MSCFNLFSYIFKSKEKSPSDEVSVSVDQVQANPPLNKPFPIPKSIPELYKKNEHNLRVFTYEELINATCGFNRSLKIGEGGFGSVYRGKMKLSSNTPRTIDVAVKKLNKNGLQGHKEWLSEVQFLGVVSHPNLVKLLGYCNEDGERGIQRLLVYEYMPNRSFENHLFGRSNPTLPWKTRLNIILGAAEGLAYLHTGMEVQVIYRDFKASNVLLDENMKPKLSDFGLAREGPSEGHTHVSTMPVGTHGYAAPEYVETGHLKAESDVWGFGVVLYEVLTGRRALDRSRPVSEQKLLVWVKRFPVESKMFVMVIDPKIRDTISVNSARIIARLAEACLSRNPKDRPSMVQVVDTIKLAIRESESESVG